MSYVKSRNELEWELTEQIDLLRASCESYDKGLTAEAKRMALCLRILLHDNKRNSHSLLGQLDIKEALHYYSIPNTESLDLPAGTLFYSCLGIAQTEQGVQHKANLHKPQTKLSFDEWWSKQLLYKAGSTDTQITRDKLVLGMSDQDGGAHVDSQLREGSYLTLSRYNGLGWENMLGKSEREFMRQVAHELLTTLDEQIEDFITTIKKRIFVKREAFSATGQVVSVNTDYVFRDLNCGNCKAPQVVQYNFIPGAEIMLPGAIHYPKSNTATCMACNQLNLMGNIPLFITKNGEKITVIAY